MNLLHKVVVTGSLWTRVYIAGVLVGQLGGKHTPIGDVIITIQFDGRAKPIDVHGAVVATLVKPGLGELRNGCAPVLIQVVHIFLKLISFVAK